MRKPSDDCLLCLVNKATKTNSHIVPKFLSKGILGTEGAKQGFHLKTTTPDIKPIKSQDTAKENFILCPDCETYIQLLETYFSEHIHKRILNTKFDSNFEYLSNDEIKLANCINSNLLIHRLFVISIYWRTSITSAFPFYQFKVSNEEYLRSVLNRHKTKSIKILLERAHDSELNDISLVVMRSNKGIDQTSNFLYAVESADLTFGLVLNEYIIMMGLNESPTTLKFGDFKNKGSRPFKIILFPNEAWESFKKSLIHMVTDKSIKVAREKGIKPWFSKKT